MQRDPRQRRQHQEKEGQQMWLMQQLQYKLPLKNTRNGKLYKRRKKICQILKTKKFKMQR